MRRRTFLLATGQTFLVGGAPALAMAPAGLDEGAAGLSRDRWELLAAVQDHLLPSEPGAPGASEIQAASYLFRALTAPRVKAQERERVGAGLERLDRLTRELSGRDFVALPPDERERVLRTFEGDPEGRQWLALILDYLLEALLTDPLYGGNPDGIGWRWLEHRPGFPRPVPSKEWYRL